MITTAQPRSKSLAAHWLIAALACVLVIILAQYLLKIHHNSSNNRSAFLRWRTQLQELDDGVNVWNKFAYPNPPIMAIVLKPFMDLPPSLGAATWFLFKALLALAAIAGVWKLLDAPERPFPVWGKALAALLTLRPIEGDLVHGNVNLLILFLIVATLIAFCHGRDWLAGLCLGLSIACKLTPALFLVYFLYKRAWTALIASVISLMLFVVLVPSLFFGVQNNLDYHRSWYRQMVAPYTAGVVTSEHKNQSLPGLMHRMLSDEASFSDYEGEHRVVLETHNVVSWDRSTVQVAVLACMALFVRASAYFCRSSSVDRPRLQVMLEFSVVVLGMLLFCERTWKHHCVTLLLPFTVLAYCLTSVAMPRHLRWYCGITLGVAATLVLSTSSGFFAGGDRFADLAEVYGAYTWAFLVLLASMFVILRWTNSARLDDERLRPHSNSVDERTAHPGRHG